MHPPMSDAIDTTPTPTIEDSNKDWYRSILKAKSPPSSTTRLFPRVPMILKERKDHEKYYVPEVVSLGPYHHGKPNLESVEGFKSMYTNKLLKGNQDMIQNLYDNLAKMVPTLRRYYEDNADNLSDDVFTRMMLLDGCFILYVIEHIFLNNETDALGLTSRQIKFVLQDMFLLENQIPYQVLTEVMNFVPDETWDLKINRFVDDNILAIERCRRRPQANAHVSEQNINHLLELLQTRLTKDRSFDALPYDRYTFRNVRELVDVGIRFKASYTMSLAIINFTNVWWGFSPVVELPPIIVDDSTKPMLLNLIAYEKYSSEARDAWVTSYLCFLRSLIEDPEDVKVLRKAGVLENLLGNDKEVVELFKEICTDLVPNSFAYSHVRYGIQKHYENWNDTLMSELNHVCVTNPWAFFSLFGVISLFLSVVQTYFTVWSPKG